MPTVPQYNPGEVGYGGGVSARQDVQAPAGAFGIDPGAVASVGQGVDTAAKYLDAYQQTQDEARAMAISRPVATQYRQALYGADDGSTPGYLALSGAQALNGREGVTTQLTKARDDAVAQAAQFNPRVRALVEKTLQSGFDSTMNSVAQHANTQGIKYANDETAAQATLEGQNYAAAFPFDPAGAQAHMRAGETYARKVAIAQGGGDAEVALAVQKYRTQAHSAVIDNYLAQGGPNALKAQQYFNVVQGQMDPETRAAVETKVNAAALTAGANAFAAAQAASGAAMPAGAPGGSTADAIRTAAGDPTKGSNLVTIAMLESGLNPQVKPNGQSVGLFQFQPATFHRLLPDGDINNPADQIKAAGLLYDENRAGLRSALGREPTLTEIYLAHQQGLGGARALLRADPNANAAQAMVDAGVYHTLQGATAAIAQNGGSKNSTVGQFLQTWKNRVALKAGQSASAAGPGLNPTSGQVSSVPDWPTMEAQARAFADTQASSLGLDPATVEASYVAAARSRYNDLHGQQTAAESDASDQVDRMFVSASPPTSLSDIPIALRSRLSGAKLKSLNDAFTKADDAGPYAKSSDPVTFQALSDLHASGRGRLATVDMTRYLGKLSKGDFDTVLGWKRDELTPDPEKKARQVTLGTVSGVANTLAEAVGLGGKQHVEDRAQLSVALQRKVDDWRTQNPGKEPDDKAIHAMADGLLLSGSWKGEPGVFGAPTVRGPLYKAPVGAQITFPVPKPAYDRIVASYARNRPGQPPSGAEIRNAYFRGHAAGMFQ